MKVILVQVFQKLSNMMGETNQKPGTQLHLIRQEPRKLPGDTQVLGTDI